VKSSKKLSAALLALAFLVAACGGDDDTEASTDTTEAGESGSGSGASGEPIVLGMVMSTSGPAATLGEFQARGVELAVEQLNASGGVDGRPVELIARDDQSNPERAVAETQSLIDEGVDAIVGSGITATCYAMEPVVREAGVPTYCLSGAPPPEGNVNMFFGLPPLPALAGAQFPWMEEQGYTSMALLHSTDATGNLLGEQIPRLAESVGVEIAGKEQFDLTAQDVTAQLTKLRENDPDVLYIGNTGGGPTATVLRGLRDLGWDVPVVLTWSNATDAFLKTVAPVAAEETYIGGTNLYVAGELSDDAPGKDKYDEYVALYAENFDDQPDMYSASGYDAVQILTRAIAATDGSGEAVRQYMIDELGSYTGVTGAIDFTEDDLRGISSDSVILMRITADGYARVDA
jgi:branched-chain amino acid transport system substrate-binding protein